MNRKIEKQIRKKGKKKRFYLSIFAFIMLLFVPVFVYASEMKSDGKTTQVIEEENKTVRVGYFPYSNVAILMPVDISVIPAALLISVVTHD